jgi:hypothetical protein
MPEKFTVTVAVGRRAVGHAMTVSASTHRLPAGGGFLTLLPSQLDRSRIGRPFPAVLRRTTYVLVPA